MMMLKARSIVLLHLLCLTCTVSVVVDAMPAAEKNTEASADTPAGATAMQEGEELLLFEEFPTVVSATRQELPTQLSTVPVSVIRAEDIHHSGLVTLAEILQFVPSVDVLEIDRNRFAIGVRGLHDTFSERTLSLIDGRYADSAIFGGSELLRMPLLLEDIERIEIVRGPGGAAWGANAFNGVINVITKDPEQTVGGLFTTTFNELGDLYSHLRWGAIDHGWAWRASTGFEERRASSRALDRTDFVSRDFARQVRFDGRASRQLSDASRLSFGLGYSDFDQGDFETLGYWPMRDGRLITQRAFARLDRRFANGVEGYAQWFNQRSSSELPALLTSESREHNLELQLDLPFFSNHELLVGGNLRSLRIDAEVRDPQDFILAGIPAHEFWAGAFVIDRWRVGARTSLEGQLRIDDSSENGTDWSGRLSALISVDAEGRRAFRFSAARAFRAPAIGVREGRLSRFPIAPDLFALMILPAESLGNEETWTLETGFAAVMKTGFQLRFDVYYQRFEELVGFRGSRQSLIPPIFIQTFTATNLAGAEGRGATLELAMNPSLKTRLAVWMSVNDFTTELPEQVLRAYLPATYKAGLSGHWSADPDWDFHFQYRYVSKTPHDPGATLTSVQDIPSSHRLDLTAAKNFRRGTYELLVGVEDLLDDTELAIPDLASTIAHPTPGRTVFGRLQLGF